MKKILLGILLGVAALGAYAKNDNDTTICYTVDPVMHCANCETKIKSNLRFEKGIKKIDASAKKGIVAVTFDKTKNSDQGLREAFTKIGYQAVASGSSCAKAEGCRKAEKTCAKAEGCRKAEKACEKAEGKTCCKAETKTCAKQENCRKAETTECCKKKVAERCVED